MNKAKNVLFIALWIGFPTFFYFAQANQVIATANWPNWLLRFLNLILYGIWPVIPLIFYSKPKFQYVNDPNRKWRNEVPLDNPYSNFGFVGLITLTALSLAVYFFGTETMQVPAEIFVAPVLIFSLFSIRTHHNNHLIQQFFSLSSNLDYDYNDLYLQMKKLEKDRQEAATDQKAVADNSTHT